MEYDSNQRCAPPNGDETVLTKLEVRFAIPTYMTPSQQRRMLDLFDEIVQQPSNEPQEGVHWVFQNGSKPSLHDDEPVVNDGVYYVATAARGFGSDKERARVLEERRPSEFTCPKCGGHTFGSNRGVTDSGAQTWVRYCNGRGQRGKFSGDRFIPTEGESEPRIRCDFTWPESDDAKYGLKPIEDRRPSTGSVLGVRDVQYRELLGKVAELRNALSMEQDNLRNRIDGELEYFAKGKLYVYDGVVKKLTHILRVGGVPEPSAEVESVDGQADRSLVRS